MLEVLENANHDSALEPCLGKRQSWNANKLDVLYKKKYLIKTSIPPILTPLSAQSIRRIPSPVLYPILRPTSVLDRMDFTSKESITDSCTSFLARSHMELDLLYAPCPGRVHQSERFMFRSELEDGIRSGQRR